MEERAFAAAVAEQAGLGKEEAADLTRATLEALGHQLSGGEVRDLALDLPDGLADSLPQHSGGAHPVPLRDFVRQVSERTGLNEAEARRGARAVLTTLRRSVSSTHVQHALAQLPAEYRRFA
ncbi:DUF2267 domain-containing protein [Dactylosporangium siamense]|uniref:DUF2267 domain-containing protein n=1 Tax=Dactylosporangium siamense TaxID=685454 RepID=A0A919PDV2_9ACTN|nr:DUF2267 domain-containing protein [Dactylosporangium siamense]GIG42976.1 hypothetical protein Dsi01nite_010170 [Dactylosporangium siamense]